MSSTEMQFVVPIVLQINEDMMMMIHLIVHMVGGKLTEALG